MAQGLGTLGTLGSRLASFTGILTFGTGMSMVLAVVRVAVLTRLLEMPIYGQLTLLVIMAGFVALLCRMSVVTGTILSAFRGGDEEGGDEEEVSSGEERDDPRRLLGTGLLSALAITAAITAIAAIFHKPIVEIFLGSGGQFPVVAAALLGGLDATFHLVVTIARFERRPVTFVALQATHAASGIAVAATMILLGFGLDGAIGGLALGTLAALVPGTWVSRHRFSIALDRAHLETLVRKGAPFILITGGYWLYRHADLIMVSRYLPDADVALYRVAARVGAITSAVLGAVLMARGPLLHGPMREALQSENLLVSADSRIVKYVWFLALWLLVGLLLARDLLIQIAPPDYAGAATLIPLLGFAALATTGLTIIHRTSRIKRKKTILVTLLVLMSPLLVALSIALIPTLGVDGAAIASIVPPVLATSTYLALSQKRGREPLDLPWDRMLWGLLVAVAYSAIVVAISGTLGTIGTASSVAAALAFPAILVLAKALPRDEARRIIDVLPIPGRGGKAWQHRIAFLKHEEIETIEALLRRGVPPRQLALARELDDEAVLTKLVASLRSLGDIGTPSNIDHLIGRFLTSPANAGQRAREGEQLARHERIESADVDRLNALAEEIGGISQKRWEDLTGVTEEES